MAGADPKNYYATLGVDANATPEAIRNAYRLQARRLHPDHNRSPTATRDFQRLSEAHEVLSDPARRAAYDASAVVQSHLSSEQADHRHDPVRCSVCEKISAQPRFVIFFRTMSFIAVTTRQPVHGIFCPSCALRKGLQASLVTWLLGWWGLPWGPIYTAESLLRNLFGGKRPATLNATLLAMQARYFATTGRLDLASTLCSVAVSLARTASDDPDASKLVSHLQSLQNAIGPGKNGDLKDGWSRVGKLFLSQLGLAASILGLVALITSCAPDARRASPAGWRPSYRSR